MKKGFTLIELIITIIVIGVIALITTPIVTNVIRSSKEESYKKIVDSIEASAYNYSISNNLGEYIEYKTLALSELQQKGYLQSDDIIDPRNNSKMDGCVFYRWNRSLKQYDFEYSEACVLEDIFPEIQINITNDNNLEWMREYINLEIVGQYDNFKYCYGENNCETNKEYNASLTIEEEGEMYICATGYYGTQKGKSICTKAYKVDINKPSLAITSLSSTSSKIKINATCSDEISKVKSIEYSINDGAYQTSNEFAGLETGTYKVKVKCTDYALNESIIEQIRETSSIIPPTIAKISQTPETTPYAQELVLRITYNGTNVENPKYYYSLDNKEWTEVTTTTKDLTFISNGYVYAKTVDDKGNTASAATYTIANIDVSEPSATILVGKSYTDRISMMAECSDSESGITKYEFSKDGGSSWTSNGTTNEYTFTNLNQGVEYTFAIRCTNGSGMTKTASEEKKTATITAPVIAQTIVSQNSGYSFATARAMVITYNNTNVVNPEHYIKLSIATYQTGAVELNLYACGTGDTPGTCSTTSTTTPAANTWYKVDGTTLEFYFGQNSTIKAMTMDQSKNSASDEYQVINTDDTQPNVTITKTVSDNKNVLTASLNPATTASGYTYQWYKNGNIINGATSSSYITSESGTYKVKVTTGAGISKEASTTISSYTITYNVNGGTGTIASTTKIENITATITTDEPTKEGYVFGGWSTSASSSTVAYKSGADYTANANITLYAIWDQAYICSTGTLTKDTNYSSSTNGYICVANNPTPSDRCTASACNSCNYTTTTYGQHESCGYATCNVSVSGGQWCGSYNYTSLLKQFFSSEDKGQEACRGNASCKYVECVADTQYTTYTDGTTCVNSCSTACLANTDGEYLCPKSGYTCTLMKVSSCKSFNSTCVSMSNFTSHVSGLDYKPGCTYTENKQDSSCGNASCNYQTTTYGANCSACGSHCTNTVTDYSCPSGWSIYSGSGSSMNCYISATLPQ